MGSGGAEGGKLVSELLSCGRKKTPHEEFSLFRGDAEGGDERGIKSRPGIPHGVAEGGEIGINREKDGDVAGFDIEVMGVRRMFESSDDGFGGLGPEPGGVKATMTGGCGG
jgi:hypothetical protein